MKTYRVNAFMAGALYFLGTVFGIISAVFCGDLFTSTASASFMDSETLMKYVVVHANAVTIGTFFVLLMGISLTAMTFFLYPIFKKDSEELAMGMVIFRGAFEGVGYMIAALGFIVLVIISNAYSVPGSETVVLQTFGMVVYQFQDAFAPVFSMLFLIGATCLYFSFYRTKLIPRWLAVWGLVGVVPYFIYAVLHFFHLDQGFGVYLQMVLAPQEIVMGLWLVIKGFDRSAIDRLMNVTAA